MKKALALSFIVTTLVFFACRKDPILTDSSAKLEFSSDSILFDTVFTTIGSTTKQFRVHNNHKKTIKISSIRLAGGQTSMFRINVDGLPLISTGEIEIPGKDSIFVFVEVTVNPSNQNNPLIVRDSIIFVTNGNIQNVQLEAWGQDAYYHKPNVFPTNGFPPYSIITCDEFWTDDKPHVIYGYAVVDSGCMLTMQAGTRVHLYKNAVLWIYEGGSLKVSGSFNKPVTFQGTRLEHEYADIPGQWGKIWLSALSKENVIDWAIIKNAGIGIQVDTFPNTSDPTLLLSNSIIKNSSAACLYGQGAKITAYNCVFANAGQYTAALTLGGSYSFWHCTFANWSQSRSGPSVIINNWYKDVYGAVHSRSIDSAYFGNCIIDGNVSEELQLDSAYGGDFKYKFDHCMLKTNLGTGNAYHYDTIFNNQNPLFKDVTINDYRLQSSSDAINKGDILIGNKYPKDLKDSPRNIDISPDLGAYEFE